MIILEEKFKWHLEAFASELFNYHLWGEQLFYNERAPEEFFSINTGMWL